MTMADPPERLPYLGGENDDIDMSGTSPTVEDDAPENVRTDEYDQADTQPQEEEAPEAAPAAPAQPDLTATLAQFAELQRQDLEDRRNRDEQARRSADEQRQRESAPKPLMEQEEWVTRYDEAAAAAAYDPDARRIMMRMNGELAQEQARQMMGSFQGDMQLEMRADSVMRQSVESSRTQYGDLVSADDFGDVAARVFGANRANMTRALDPQINPQAAETRQLLAWAAMGKAQAEGRNVAPARNVPPPNPRSAARNGNPAKAPASNQMWADKDWVDGTMADLYRSKK